MHVSEPNTSSRHRVTPYDNGAPRNTLASIVHALQTMPEWAGVLAASEFDQEIVFRRAPPWTGERRNRLGFSDGKGRGETERSSRRPGQIHFSYKSSQITDIADRGQVWGRVQR
jgi:hypothetical protein